MVTRIKLSVAAQIASGPALFGSSQSTQLPSNGLSRYEAILWRQAVRSCSLSTPCIAANHKRGRRFRIGSRREPRVRGITPPSGFVKARQSSLGLPSLSRYPEALPVEQRCALSPSPSAYLGNSPAEPKCHHSGTHTDSSRLSRTPCATLLLTGAPLALDVDRPR